MVTFELFSYLYLKLWTLIAFSFWLLALSHFSPEISKPIAH